MSDSLYQEVKLTVGFVLTLGSGPSYDCLDTYTTSNVLLSIPLDNLGGTAI